MVSLDNRGDQGNVRVTWDTAVMTRKASGKKGLYSIVAAKHASAGFGRVRSGFRNGVKFDLTDAASIVQFREAAAKFREANLGNQERARKILAEEGIFMLDDELTL